VLIFLFVLGLALGMLYIAWKRGYLYSPKNSIPKKHTIDTQTRRAPAQCMSLAVLAGALIFIAAYIETGPMISPIARFITVLCLGMLVHLAELLWRIGTFSWKEYLSPVEFWIALVLFFVSAVIFVISNIVPVVAILFILVMFFDMVRPRHEESKK